MELSDVGKKILYFVIALGIGFDLLMVGFNLHTVFIYQQTCKMSFKMPIQQIKKQACIDGFK